MEVYQDSMLIITRATEPSEILWKNMKGERGLFIFRRFFLYSLALIIIVFGTSPTVIASNMGYVDFLHIFDLEWLPNGDYLLKHYFTPLFVILVNHFLLLLIDKSSSLECHETHS